MKWRKIQRGWKLINFYLLYNIDRRTPNNRAIWYWHILTLIYFLHEAVQQVSICCEVVRKTLSRKLSLEPGQCISRSTMVKTPSRKMVVGLLSPSLPWTVRVALARWFVVYVNSMSVGFNASHCASPPGPVLGQVCAHLSSCAELHARRGWVMSPVRMWHSRTKVSRGRCCLVSVFGMSPIPWNT